jgi:hypothetical protein
VEAISVDVVAIVSAALLIGLLIERLKIIASARAVRTPPNILVLIQRVV